MASVSFDRVVKRYATKQGSVSAVRDLSLDIADGEFVVLVGPSGCGKTTTLRLLAGLEQLDEGTIRIGDRLVNWVAPKDRNVAMVFQNYALYPHMTVFKNMAFGLKMRRAPRNEICAKVHQVAAMVGIEHLLDRKPAALSGGERQRVAVGRAIVRQPNVFLFDEPLSNLDAKLRVHMRTELKRLHRQLETTVIYVTHDQEEAMTLGDRLVIMQAGVIQQRGAPLDVYNAPANRFVAGFIGTPPMNFIKGSIERAGEGAAFVSDAGRWSIPAERTAKAEPLVGRLVVLGVRPEHVSINGSADQDGISSAGAGQTVSKALITVVEPMGAHVHVHLTLEHDHIVARVPPGADAAPNATVNISFDMTRIHLFSVDEDGERLL